MILKKKVTFCWFIFLLVIFLNNPESIFLPIFVLIFVDLHVLNISNEDLTSLPLWLDLLPKKGLIILISLNLDLVPLVIEIV